MPAKGYVLGVPVVCLWYACGMPVVCRIRDDLRGHEMHLVARRALPKVSRSLGTRAPSNRQASLKRPLRRNASAVGASLKK
jgi:hypothetical protein